MANTLITSSWVITEVGFEYVNQIQFVKQLTRKYDKSFMIDGARVGSTVQVKIPQRYQVTSGQALQVQNLLDQTVPVTLTDQLNVGFGWSSAQATTDLNDVRENYIMPAAKNLANTVDANAFATIYPTVSQSVGTPGTALSNISTMLAGGVKLTDSSAALSGRKVVLDPLQMANMAATASTLFNPSGAISANYKKGQFAGNQLGFDEWYQDPNRPTHTTGSFSASTPIVSSADQTGSSIATSGWASLALKRGDVLTFAGVYSVNPLSYVSTGRLRQFVVTADTVDTAGSATIPISPSIIPTGQLKNVSASPALNAAVTVLGSTALPNTTLTATASPQGIALIKDAAAFVSADLAMPNGGAKATFVRSDEWGLSIRFVEQYQSTTDQNLNRLDVLVGAATINPDFMFRIWS